MIAHDSLPRQAVVDIGSNSVRLVIFSGPPRVPVTITNEKSLCGLGHREPDTGNLRQEAVEQALAVLRRFRLMLDYDQPEDTFVFATAAVREAPNGGAFLDAVRAIGFDPKMISGLEEARLAGLGILCSAPEINEAGTSAIGGDLGGGSLELTHLTAGQVSEPLSLPIGALRMHTDFGSDLLAAERHVRPMLGAHSWLTEAQARGLYVVGGSWRAIARVAMHLSEHPLAILDHYAMPRDQAVAVCRHVEASEPEELARLNGVQKKRAPTLPMAALILRMLIEHTSVQEIIVSACGVREGLLFDQLSPEERDRDPLDVIAADMARRYTGGRTPSAEAVLNFTDPLFADDRFRRIRRAAGALCRIVNMTHPDRRADHAAILLMSAPLVGVDHTERTLLAAILRARFVGSLSKSDRVIPLTLLTEDQQVYAERVGLALRLATSLRLPLYEDSSGITLSKDDRAVVLTLPPGLREILAEGPAKDFSRLASSFGLEADIR